jgi:anti-sigma-K factor RskA
VDKPISAGTFGTDRGNKSRVLIRQIPELSRIKKFAVSLEPEGGQPQPTGQIYLSGQL